jgi:3-oxoadipate enol-lactonase
MTQTPGTDDGATLVLINPIGNTAECWQFAGLDDGHPFEYPGHGKRERQPGWTHQTFADELVSSFSGPLDLVGMSMGGTVVANILVRHPGRVRSALIACSGSITSAGYSPEANEKRLAAYARRGGTALEGGMQAILEDTLTRWFSPYALRTDLPGVRYARETLLAMDPEAWNDIWNCQAISESLPLDSLRSIQQPVTIVGGIYDQAAGLRGLAEVHELIPNSRYEIMPASHMMHLEQPEFLRAALDRHRAWFPEGKRVEKPIGSCVWLNTADNYPEGISA